MAHTNYEDAKKGVFKGMWLLAGVTLIEVFVSLFGKGHLGIDPGNSMIIVGIIGFALVALSLYKAYFIIYEFMHMGHEVRGLRATVLLPVLLLVWAVVAFFNEGAAWKTQRVKVQDRNQQEKGENPQLQGQIYELEIERESI